MDLPDPLVVADPERMSGTPCFAGTRVPVQSLFDYIAGGDSLDEFLASFPDVTREHAVAVLHASKAAMILREFERETYVASRDELAAIDQARDQMAKGKRATRQEIESAFARFR